jgi:Cu(I)/Ag(I) efflux system membrane fusion protein
VEFRLGGAPGLFVPMDAVLDSGLAKTVYLDLGDGHFEPRTVETGREFNGKVEIVKGLTAGERIVISGNFLVDSESRLRAAGSGAHQHDQPAH